MKTNANGIEIHYELSGNPDASVVVLSHSLASSLIMWEPQLGALEKDFRVLRYDMRGHGKSEVVEGAYTLEMLGDDVVGLLDALAVESAHFVGLSIGGMIGQGLALNHVERLLSVILCDTSPVLPEAAKPIFRERMQMAREQGMTSLVDETLARWFTASFLEQAPPMVDRIRNQIAATPLNGFVGCCHAILSLDYLDRLPEIGLKTLVIVGEDDPGTPVEAARAIQAGIPDSKLVILSSAAHLSNIEQAEEFNAALLEFLHWS